MSKPTPYATKVAVPLPPEDDVRRAMGESYKPDVLNVTKMLAGTGDCFRAVVALVKALFQADDIGAKLREVVTLRAATLLDAPYEWQQNSQMALNTGLSQVEIDAVAVDGRCKGWRQTTFWDATRSTNWCGAERSPTIPCPACYGEVGTRKLILAIGYFNLLAMFLNGCRVPIETSDKIGASTSPLG